MPTKNGILFNDEAIRSRAPIRPLGKPLLDNAQGPLRAHGGRVIQPTTGTISTVDPDSLELAEEKLDHPQTSTRPKNAC